MKGYAVKDESGIQIRTIMDTKVAAMVNWLHVFAQMTPLARTTDEEIERLFAMYEIRGVKCVPVEITEIEDAPASQSH